MKRALALALVGSLAGGARAQNLSPAEPALPPPPPPSGAPSYHSMVRGHRPSPTWSQDRSFTATRFWLLDPGAVELAVWLRDETPRAGASSIIFQQEVELGIAPHLQLDLYENLTFDYELHADGTTSPSRGVQQEGNQIELRIAIPSYYGQIFGNPVVYLEWRPRHAAPDRAEGRLLVGGEVLPRLYLAMNLYYEVAVEGAVRDQEAGASLGLGYAVLEKLRVGIEARGGGDQLGGNTWHAVGYVGPSVIFKPLGKRLKILGSWLFGLNTDATAWLPTLIVATQL